MCYYSVVLDFSLPTAVRKVFLTGGRSSCRRGGKNFCHLLIEVEQELLPPLMCHLLMEVEQKLLPLVHWSMASYI